MDLIEVCGGIKQTEVNTWIIDISLQSKNAQGPNGL